ncbi:MAG: hypothetical protein MZU97_24445 [Bacillus subtilis]|nr:hypothetical protein [Bacillus subtilis]
MGTAQNDDVYFQAKEIQRTSTIRPIPDVVAGYMDEISKETGRDYKPFSYYGASASRPIVIIAMGSVTEAIREVIDYKLAKGEKVGLD